MESIIGSVDDDMLFDLNQEMDEYQDNLPEIKPSLPEPQEEKRERIDDTPNKSRSFRQDSEEDFYEEKNHRKLSIPWQQDEDKFLVHLVHQHEGKNWQLMAFEMHKQFPNRPRRCVNQCNQRWMRVLNPTIVKGKWSADEDRQLLSAVKQSAPRKWKQIATLLPGRTDIQVRYRIKKIAVWLMNHGVSAEYLE